MDSDDWRSLVHPIVNYQLTTELQVFVSSIQALHRRLQDELRLAVLEKPANDFADRLTKERAADKVSAAVAVLEEAIRPENHFVPRRRPIRIMGTGDGHSSRGAHAKGSSVEQSPQPLGLHRDEIPAARQLIDQLNQREYWVLYLDEIVSLLEYLTRRALPSILQKPLEELLGTLKDIRGAARARREFGFYAAGLVLQSIESGRDESCQQVMKTLAKSNSAALEIQAACRQLLATDTDDEWLTVTKTSKRTGIPKDRVTKLCNVGDMACQGKGRDRRVSLRSAEKWHREHEKQKDRKARRNSS